MANIEKIIKVTDAALDCIPLVSSLTNAAHAIYKLAHKVDTVNPVAPGLKTSIQIHSLSKERFDCFIGFIPVLGNIYKLVEFVARAILRFNAMPGDVFSLTPDDDFLTAARRNNSEIVHLCLQNKALDDPQRANRILNGAAHSSNNQIFKQVFYSRKDWKALNLLKALQECWDVTDDQAANANDILDFWTTHGLVLDANETSSLISTMENFRKKGKVDLERRMIAILPEKVPVSALRCIFFQSSWAQPSCQGEEVEETGVLTEELRNELIAKSDKASLQELKNYYLSFANQLQSQKTASDYRAIHFDIMNQLLDRAQLLPNEIGEFIETVTRYDEFSFLESLIAKYEGQLDYPSKVKILKGLLPSDSPLAANQEQRARLFALWVDKWKTDLSAKAHHLYRSISTQAEIHLSVSNLPFQMPASAQRDCLSEESVKNIYDPFQQILLNAFPGCDQAPKKQES